MAPFSPFDMARSRAKSSTKEIRRQAQGETCLKRPQGIEKRPQPLRRSARLQKAQQNNGLKHLLPSPPITNAPDPEVLHRLPPPDPEANRETERKRKRSQEVEAFQEGPSEKRLRADTNGNRSSHRVETWLQKGSYPEDYFESRNETWEDIKADTLARRFEADGMNNLLARKKSTASLRRQVLEASTITPTEQIEDKSLPYRSLGYERELANRGSYLDEANEGITKESKTLCQALLSTTQMVPQDTLFSDDRFDKTCRKLRTRNEARIVEDVSPLIAPSAETLATCGATELDHLVFNTDERWSESIPITDTRPKPDRCVGFSESAFTNDQLQKLKPFIGSLVPINYLSSFLATWRMLFPFFACEAKCGIGELDVADKQNAHSMSMAVRGIVELFKLVGCENELHRKVLTFSISHDGNSVRIYGHYSLITNRVATFYRHPIHSFDFTAQSGRDKWMAYQFTKNVYFEFMPKLHKLICSAIDQISLDTPLQGSDLPPQTPLGDSFGSSDLESEQPDSQERAASTPASQNTAGSKRKRLTGNAVLQRQLDQRDEQIERLMQEMKEQRQKNESLRRSANSGNDSEVVPMLRQELDRQRQENERLRQSANPGNDSEVVTMLRQENERQPQEHRREMGELKDLLKQSLSAQSKQRAKK